MTFFLFLLLLLAIMITCGGALNPPSVWPFSTSPRRETVVGTYGALSLFLLIVFSGSFAHDQEARRQQARAERGSRATAVLPSGRGSTADSIASSPNAGPMDSTPAPSKWAYSEDSDPMTSRVAHTAEVASENTVDFAFPYNEPQHGTLLLRSNPSYGRDVMLQIERGQFICPSYDGCPVRVRFDEGPAESWTGAPPQDNSTEVIFIRGYERFLRRLRRAKTVRIAANIYQEGAPVFEFDVRGFSVTAYTGTTR